MAHGQINVRFADGCVEEYKAPKFVHVEPGHEGWVVGDEPAVLIEFDFEQETVPRLNVLLDDVQRSSRGLERLLNEVNEQPASLIFGRNPMPPGPGEPGFTAQRGTK